MVSSKVYLNVPYAEKDAAKALGARWDPSSKKWYAPADANINTFSKWQTESSPSVSKSKKTKPGTSTINPSSGVTTYPTDKDFVAYNGEQPPWE